jgi:histidinol dehydrogenase
MLGIPAVLAGCKEIVLCSSPNSAGTVAPEILYCSRLLGIEKVYAIGGAQAIAAMAYGTETIPQVAKIFGPGNQYVTEAKRQVEEIGTGIDLPAGPSELVVIVDNSACADFVAADLLSQAEHGADSQVLLLSNDSVVIDEVLACIETQLESLPRKDIAKACLVNSKAIAFETIAEALDFSNLYAPEHLIINTEDADILAEQVTNAGSVFIGNYSPESAGDYASGTNHVLPTGGFARHTGGVSVASFQKKITFQKLTKIGLESLAPTIINMAKQEGLEAHSKAVEIRLRSK